jgi:hypothetical protein
MITLFIMPAFSGTKKETIKALLLCLTLDLLIVLAQTI